MWYLTRWQSEIWFSSSHLQHFFFDCKFVTRVAPLMFAVNIKTNGNPHHRPWSIGKRLLSSWLPVRSAKDQGGKGHTHIVRWKPRPNGTGSHLSQSSLASMDSQPQPATGLFQIETSRTFVNVEYKNIYTVKNTQFTWKCLSMPIHND